MKKGVIIVSTILIIYIILQIYCRPQKQEFSIPAVVLQVQDGVLTLINTTTIDVDGVLRKTITGKTLYQGDMGIDYFLQKDIRMYSFQHPDHDELLVNEIDNLYSDDILYTKSGSSTDIIGKYIMQTTSDFDAFSFLYDLESEEEDIYILGPATSLEEAKKLYDEMKVNKMRENAQKENLLWFYRN